MTMFDEIEMAREQKKKDEQHHQASVREKTTTERASDRLSTAQPSGSVISTSARDHGIRIATGPGTVLVPKEKIHQLGLQPSSARGAHPPVFEKLNTQPDITRKLGDTGNECKMIYMGPYTKGLLAQRSTSNDPTQTITSPKKTLLPPSIQAATTLSTRKSPPGTTFKKPELTAANLIPMSPSTGTKSKPKGLGLLGMKFAPKPHH